MLQWLTVFNNLLCSTYIFRSILQIREEMDDASVILEYFLKSAGLPSDAVEKFSSKK